MEVGGGGRCRHGGPSQLRPPEARGVPTPDAGGPDCPECGLCPRGSREPGVRISDPHHHHGLPGRKNRASGAHGAAGSSGADAQSSRRQSPRRDHRRGRRPRSGRGSEPFLLRSSSREFFGPTRRTSSKRALRQKVNKGPGCHSRWRCRHLRPRGAGHQMYSAPAGCSALGTVEGGGNSSWAHPPQGPETRHPKVCVGQTVRMAAREGHRSVPPRKCVWGC